MAQMENILLLVEPESIQFGKPLSVHLAALKKNAMENYIKMLTTPKENKSKETEGHVALVGNISHSPKSTNVCI